MDEYCRLCGSEEGIKVSIFEEGSDYVKKIHKILPITIFEYDPLPKSMCHRCSFKVNDFYEFRINCIRSMELFKSKLPWPKKKLAPNNDVGRPMVQLVLDPINRMSPGERLAPEEPLFVDTNDSLIVIDDDSPPHPEVKSMPLRKNEIPKEKIIMKIKRTQLKRRSRPKSVWDSKKRRKRTYNSCRITEVVTTTMDEYNMMEDIENDPLGLSPAEATQNKNNNVIVLDDKSEIEEDSVKEIKSEDNPGSGVQLPKYILVTQIPRVGAVYTCEKCGRTFLSPQPASLHTCDDLSSSENINDKQENRDTSNSATDFYSCSECSQVFSRHSQLIAHQKKHFEVASSSDDKPMPVARKKKQRRRTKMKSESRKTDTSLSISNQIETGIVRHSLLSSDSCSN